MNFLKKMYGNFKDKDEVLKFVVLGITFFLIIGTYWTLRPLKDGLFASIVGAKWQPYAKILSMFAVFPIVMLYSKLVDWFKRDQVFYILSGFYAITALILTNMGKQFFGGHNGPVVAITGVLILAIGLMIWVFQRVVPANERRIYRAKGSESVDHDKAGFFEGLKLLVNTPYLLS